MFGNPVAQAFIRPPGSPFIVDSFRVTAAFGAIDKDHKTPHEGVDIGNGRCGEPVLAMADGTVSMAEKLGKAKVVRIVHPQFPGHETGYAHLAEMLVEVDQPVTRGKVIGLLGRTGADACHLHIGLKLNRVEIDSWPLLDQNMEGEMIKGSNPIRIVNSRTRTHAATHFRADPSTSLPDLMLASGATVFEPDFSVVGQDVVGSSRWLSGMLPVNGVLTRGYFHESTLEPLSPIEPIDCAAEVAAAVAPLDLQVAALNVQVAELIAERDTAKAALQLLRGPL